jgi:hypothetical protein
MGVVVVPQHVLSVLLCGTVVAKDHRGEGRDPFCPCL